MLIYACRYKTRGGKNETTAAAKQIMGGKKKAKKKEASKDDVRRMFDEIDEDGSGLLDRGETKVLMLKLFPGMSDAEFDVAFAKMDDDGSGAMDTKEMRHALTLLKEDGKRVSDKPKQLKKRADECGATAKKAQIQLHHLLQEDRDAENEAQQRAEQERAEREAKAAAVKEAKAAAILAKLAEEEAKQAEFASRVNSRR